MRVLVACGGTGGHIFPALSFLETLKSKEKDLELVIVVTKRKIESRILPKEYKIVYINLSPLRLRLDIESSLALSYKIKCALVALTDLKNLAGVINLLLGTLESIYIILKFHPDVVIGFGGYTTFPIVFLAKTFGIKTAIHEQNVIMGISNRILAKFVDRIAISFNQTKDYLKDFYKKTFFTGNPLRKEMLRVDKEEALGFFGFSKDKFTILVMGGSQGSRKINIIFLKTLSEIEDKSNLQVIHLSGTADFDMLLDSYKKMDVSFKLWDFLKPMHYAYSATDLVITRAGAITISEIIFFGLPAIIVPYPFAYRHQIANAKVLVDKRAAILIEDSALDAIILRDTIMDLFMNPEKIHDMRLNCGNILPTLKPQLDLSDVVLSLVR